MSNPRITYGCVPLCAAVALFGLGSHVLIAFLRSVGIIAVAVGVLVLVLTAVGRASPF
jgi:hypothetical protein